MEKIVCIGLGEEFAKCEPALRNEYEIVAIINDAPNTWGKFYNNIPVSSIDILNRVDCDFVLLTAVRYQEILLTMLQANFHGKMKFLTIPPPPIFVPRSFRNPSERI